MDSIITQVREDEQLNVFPNDLRDKGEKIRWIWSGNFKLKLLFHLWLKQHIKKFGEDASVKWPFEIENYVKLLSSNIGLYVAQFPGHKR
jgi:hypothetical protein